MIVEILFHIRIFLDFFFFVQIFRFYFNYMIMSFIHLLFILCDKRHTLMLEVNFQLVDELSNAYDWSIFFSIIEVYYQMLMIEVYFSECIW